jgi:hypothetical membrane protein
MLNLRSPGLFLFIGGLEMLFLLHLAEFLYPGYSVSQDYISELGVGPTGPRVVFTIALQAFGLLVLTAAWQLREKDRGSKLWIMLMVSAIGAIGVGTFDMDDYSALHGLSALLAFLFGNLAAVYSSKMALPPVSHLFVVLGVLGLAALALLGGEIDAGLGLGGMERMVFYPAMFWLISFGMYLMAEEEK